MPGAGWLAGPRGRDGADHGTVTVEPAVSGTMVVQRDLADVSVGTLAGHLHETSDCSAEEVSSTCGHVARHGTHGVESEDGPHPGDLTDVLPDDGGVVQVQVFNAGLAAEMMTDDDGAAFVVHAGADDEESQPAGESGARIACSLFEPREGQARPGRAQAPRPVSIRSASKPGEASDLAGSGSKGAPAF